MLKKRKIRSNRQSMIVEPVRNGGWIVYEKAGGRGMESQPIAALSDTEALLAWMTETLAEPDEPEEASEKTAPARLRSVEDDDLEDLD